jgi:hypothetical protein
MSERDDAIRAVEAEVETPLIGELDGLEVLTCQDQHVDGVWAVRVVSLGFADAESGPCYEDEQDSHLDFLVTGAGTEDVEVEDVEFEEWPPREDVFHR